MNKVLEICERMVRVDRLIKSSRDAKVRAVLRGEYKKLADQLEAHSKEWSGYPDPKDPDNFWIDDKTGERVNARTGKRT